MVRFNFDFIGFVLGTEEQENAFLRLWRLIMPAGQDADMVHVAIRRVVKQVRFGACELDTLPLFIQAVCRYEVFEGGDLMHTLGPNDPVNLAAFYCFYLWFKLTPAKTYNRAVSAANEICSSLMTGGELQRMHLLVDNDGDNSIVSELKGIGVLSLIPNPAGADTVEAVPNDKPSRWRNSILISLLVGISTTLVLAFNFGFELTPDAWGIDKTHFTKLYFAIPVVSLMLGVAAAQRNAESERINARKIRVDQSKLEIRLILELLT